MIKLRIALIVLAINGLLVAWLVQGCAAKLSTTKSTQTTGRTWTVSMDQDQTSNKQNVLTLAFGNGVAAGGSIVSGGYTSSFAEDVPYDLFIAGGATAGGPCQLQGAGGAMVITGGVTVPASGTVSLNIGCNAGSLTQALQVAIGQSTTSLLDTSNNYIIQPGKSAICTIVPPGQSGVVGCTVTY